ncbi:hypothetical protein HPB52_025492 [Rhipicephalus sanguineus]|uniref:Uncharacterized protein n=1 Tax=Rhipicephalus sanguineus TaxID=34632 RepID=A0A9D4PAP4_RHISA|nr:hypothetical protein HPB52_025492 [Rhipicephalus sanguineus]
MVPHECNPMCIACGGPHLTRSLECTGKFTKLQQPGPRTSGSPTKPKRQPTGKAQPPARQQQQRCRLERRNPQLSALHLVALPATKTR